MEKTKNPSWSMCTLQARLPHLHTQLIFIPYLPNIVTPAELQHSADIHNSVGPASTDASPLWSGSSLTINLLCTHIVTQSRLRGSDWLHLIDFGWTPWANNSLHAMTFSFTCYSALIGEESVRRQSAFSVICSHLRWVKTEHNKVKKENQEHLYKVTCPSCVSVDFAWPQSLKVNWWKNVFRAVNSQVAKRNWRRDLQRWVTFLFICLFLIWQSSDQSSPRKGVDKGGRESMPEHLSIA